jgi:hypothetical protein
MRLPSRRARSSLSRVRRVRCVSSESSSSSLVPVMPSSGVTVMSSTRGLARLRRGPHRDLALGIDVAGVARALQRRDQAVGLGEQVGVGPAARLVEAHRQQALGGDVRVDHAELRVEHDDAGGQRVEQVGGVVVRERRRQGAFSDHRALARRGESPWRSSAAGAARRDQRGCGRFICWRTGLSTEGCVTWKVTEGVRHSAAPVSLVIATVAE